MIPAPGREKIGETREIVLSDLPFSFCFTELFLLDAELSLRRDGKISDDLSLSRHQTCIGSAAMIAGNGVILKVAGWFDRNRQRQSGRDRAGGTIKPGPSTP